jgi:hypothetical protein
VRRFNGQTIPSERPGVMRENSMLVLLDIFSSNFPVYLGLEYSFSIVVFAFGKLLKNTIMFYHVKILSPEF